jgi:DNA-binding CsgD family transcriptional regulator/GAF domain-containing protein
VNTTPNKVDYPGGERILTAVADAITDMYGASPRAQSSVQSDAILRTVTSVIADRLPVTCMAILMKSDPETSRVVFADNRHPDYVLWLEGYIASLLRPHEAPTTGMSRKVIETGGPILIRCMTLQQLRGMASEWGQKYMDEHPMPAPADRLSLLMVPMRSGPAVVGTLAISDWGCQQVLGGSDIEWLQRVADRVGITVETAQLRNKAIDRAERIAAMSDVALAISSGQDLRATLKLIVERVVATLRVEAADVVLVDADEGGMTVAASTGFRSGFNAEIRGHMPSEAGKRWVMEHNIGSPSTTDWIGQSRRWMLGREGLRSYTAAPLMAGRRFAGALEIFSRNDLEPDDEWLGFLDAMAALAAIALNSSISHEARGRGPDPKAAVRIASPDLSEREMEILRMVVDGASNRDVAEKLHLSENTIKFHIRQLLEKSGAANRTELATRAVQQGWV